MTTDRPETVFDAKSNIIVPPVSSDFIVKLIDHMSKHDELLRKMEKSRRLYGSNVGHKVVSVLSKLMSSGERPFKWAHESLGLWKEKSKGVEYL